MKKPLWSLAIWLFTLLGCQLFVQPFPLPEATTTGADTAGFRIGDDVIIPRGGVTKRNFVHNLQSHYLYFSIQCKSDNRGLNYDFSLELNDSLLFGGSYAADRSCPRKFSIPPGSMCVTLENKNTGRIYEGSLNHTFDLRISHLTYGDLTPALWLSSLGDTIRTHKRSIICSGSFSGTLAAANGDLISIEDGRFDLSDSEDLLLLQP